MRRTRQVRWVVVQAIAKAQRRVWTLVDLWVWDHFGIVLREKYLNVCASYVSTMAD